MFPEYFIDNLASFRYSLSPKYNRDMVFKAGEGAGRSGSFFFFSHDNKFIIKTMTEGELDLYLEKLPEFCEHFLHNKQSLLAKIFGVFTINTESMKEVHVMLMENTAQLRDATQITHVFDLKGSTVDRMVKGATKRSTTLKDQNFLKCCDYNLKKNGVPFISFAKQDRQKLLEVVRKDVAFLKSQGLMDYSMFICREKKPKSVNV